MPSECIVNFHFKMRFDKIKNNYVAIFHNLLYEFEFNKVYIKCTYLFV